MKKYLRIIVLITIPTLFFNSCIENDNKETKTKVEEKISNENFDWLLGNWKRLNEEEGKETFENWEKIKETEYSGIGFTMQNGDTIKQEKIRLTKTSGKWNLTVKVPEESEAITFNGVSHNENEFICENNEMDFPNRIKYWKNGDKINAAVSGGKMKISFEFERLEMK